MSNGRSGRYLHLSLAAFLLLAGCSGLSLPGFQSDPTATDPETPLQERTETRTTVSTTVTSTVPVAGNISVTNDRFEEAVVQVIAVRGPLTAVNWTYENGSVRTVSESPNQLDPFSPGLGEGVVHVEPASATVLDRRSTVAPRNSSVYFPTVAPERNASYLVVVSEPVYDAVVVVRVVSCSPPHTELERYELHLGEPGGSTARSSSIRCR